MYGAMISFWISPAVILENYVSPENWVVEFVTNVMP